MVKGYNATPHSSLGVAPVEVNRENEERIFRKMYPVTADMIKVKPVDMRGLKVGSFVKLLSKRDAFTRGFKPQWTRETFVVRLINKKSPVPIVKVKDLEGEHIDGYFYLSEVQMVNEPKFEVGTVLKYGKDKMLVTRKGYPSKFDRWITRTEYKKITKRSSPMDY